MATATARSSIADILQVLGDSGVHYCILHSWQRLPERLPSDLDLVTAPADLLELEQALLTADRARVVQLVQHEATCFYFVLVVKNKNIIEYIPLDIATDYRRNGRVFFGVPELLAGRKQWNSFWIASPEVEFKYLLVKKVLKEEFPSHQQARLQRLADALGAQAEDITERLFGGRWGVKVIEWIRCGSWESLEAHLGNLRRVLLWHRVKQDPLNPLRYWLPEFPRLLQRWRHPTGFFVAVLGPDGAGKSTLIEDLEHLPGVFRKTAAFHWQPRLVSRKGGGAPVTNPHAKPPRSWLVSVAKLAYYLLDYTAGYWLQIRPQLVRSTLVLFDRYYDDLLVDPARFRYGGPKGLARVLSRLIPRPDLCLILDVPEDRLLARKQEVPISELERQRKTYRELASHLPNAILVDGSLTSPAVARQAGDMIFACLQQRYLERRPVWFGSDDDQHLKWLGEVIKAPVVKSKDRKTFGGFFLPDGRGYLIPLVSKRAAQESWSVYTPHGLKGKVAKRVLAAGLRLGVCPLTKVGVEDSAGESLFGFLQQVFGRRDTAFALSLGVPGVHRKPVVQVLSQAGTVLGYAKVGWNEATRELVRNEAQTLQLLKAGALDLAVPTVLHVGEWQGRFICVQSAPSAKTRPAPPRFEERYLQVVEELAKRSACQKRLNESAFWQGLKEKIGRISNAYVSHLAQQGMAQAQEQLSSGAVPFHRCHGDFTPWNALQIDGRLYLFDWEYSQMAPAGYDLFHFWLQTLWLLRKKPPGEIFGTVLQQAKNTLFQRYAQNLGVEPKAVQPLWLLYLLERLAFCAAEEAPSYGKLQTLAMLANLCIQQGDLCSD